MQSNYVNKKKSPSFLGFWKTKPTVNKTAGKGYRIVPVVPSFWPFPSEKPLTPDSLTILYVIKEMMQQKLSDILIWGEKKTKNTQKVTEKVHPLWTRPPAKATELCLWCHHFGLFLPESGLRQTHSRFVLS